MRGLISATLMTLLLFISTLTILPVGAQDVEDLTREDISVGLPQETESYTTVEVFDSDGNGKDEIFMGASYFNNDAGDVMSEGIHAFEYDPDTSRWASFGSGLPGEGSGLAFAALGLGDVNGDGEMDIAAPVPTRWYLDIDQGNAGVYLYSGDGSGNFDLLHKISLTNPLGTNFHDSSNEAEIVDMDGDGHNDIVVSTYIGIRIFYGDSSGTNWEEQSPQHPTQTEISGVGIGDLNNDGRLDLVGTPYQRSSVIELYIQESDRVFRSRDFKETSAGYGVKIADLDGDGNNDVVYGTNSEGIKVWLGEGRTTLTSFPCTDASSGLPSDDGPWNQVELGDINGDGKQDIISACSTLNTVNLFVNDLPTGWIEVFTDSNALITDGEPYGANFGDWDGDGQLDVAGCSWNHGANAWLVSLEGYGIPVADAGEDETMTLGETLRLDGSDSMDRDGEIIEWVWECISHSSITLTEEDTSRPGFTPEEDGEYEFELTVKDDDEQWSVPDTVVVTVLDPAVNYPPVAVAGIELFADVGEEVTLDGSSSFDQDGEIVNYIWTCTSHSVTLQKPDESDPSFTPMVPEDHRFQLIVEDDQGARSDPDYVTVHVSEILVKPTLGPFLYTDGSPIVEAAVTLDDDGNLYVQRTDQEGMVTFNKGVPPGDFLCRVVKDNVAIIEDFSVSIDTDGKVTVEGGSYPKAVTNEEDDEGTNLLIIIAVAAVIVIILAIAVYIMVMRRQPGEQVVVAEVQTQGGCPNCGKQLVFMQDFGRYYCSSCNTYY